MRLTEKPSACASGPTRSGVDAIQIPRRRRNPAAWSVSPQHDDSTWRSAAAAIASVPMRHAAAAAPGTARSREAAMTPAAAATRRRSTHAACGTAAPAAPRCAAVWESSATISAVVRQGGRTVTGGNGKARHSAGGFDETWMQTARSGLADHSGLGSKPTRICRAGGFDSDILLGCHTNGSFREQL